jgi:hypothetical protein
VPGIETNLWPWIAKIGPNPGDLNTGCVAIGDHWIVTARHVVAGSTQMQVHFDNGTHVLSTAIYPHPTDDIALVEFSQPLPGWYEPLWNPPTNGALIEIVGYGYNGSFSGGTWTWNGPYGTKRRGRNSKSQTFTGDVGGGIVGTFMLADFDSGQAAQNVFGDNLGVAEESTIAPFDSGTGAMIQEGGVWKVGGVNSWVGGVGGGPQPPQYGSIFGIVQLSAYRTWVDGIMPREVRPTGLTPIRGNIVGGNLGSLFYPENVRLVINPGVVFSSSQQPVEFEITATAPAATTPRLAFAYEGHASSANIVTRIELYNYALGQFEVVSNANSTILDSVIETVITANPSRFINSSNLQVRARISARAGGPVFSNPWALRVDRAVWNIRMP